MKISSKKISGCFLAFALLSLTAGCHNYYMASPINKNYGVAKAIDSLKLQDKYFILRSGYHVFHMKNISLDNDNKMLKATLEILPADHQMYVYKDRNEKMIYKKTDHDDLKVFNEAHIFIKPDTTISPGDYSLRLTDIKKIELITKNKAKSTTSHIVGGIVIAAASALFVVGVAALLTPTPTITIGGGGGSFCSPQVYTVNSNQSELNGTLCSGAIYASLKRTDYLPVNEIDPNSDRLNLIVRGEKNEELMLKNFQLMQVTHDAQQKILVDKNGQVLAYRNPIAPEHAFIGQGIDVVNDINAPDEKYYSFTNKPENGGSSVVLDFTKPLDATSGKLIVRGKNSNWAYYVFSEFKKLYGNYYQSFLQKKDKENSSRVLQCEVNQSLPLLVSVNNGKGWKIVDYFFTPGNAASRDMIMQLDLNNFKNQDHLQIKLQTVYRFWDIDYAAIDFSNDLPVSVSYIMPTEFYKSGNMSQPVQFSKIDTSLPIRGDEQLHLTFKINENAAGKENTYFLQGGGYYHDNTVFSEKPQLTELRKCTGKGAFDKFSRRKFEEALAVLNHKPNDTGKDFKILK